MAPSEKALKKLLLADAEGRDLTRLAEYEKVGGYESLKKAMKMEPRGRPRRAPRGGRARTRRRRLPDGSQGELPPQAGPDAKPIYLVANADESEPGTFKDREILARLPHMFIEGVRDRLARDRGEHGLHLHSRGVPRGVRDPARRARGGPQGGPRRADVLGSGWNLTVVVHRGAGAYICGEETGLLESLEGKRGQPRSKPPFPAISGVYASPTLINNVETLATVPKILELGGENYAKLGVENSRGTRLFSLSGNVLNGGNYEVELGTSLRELIYDIGGGIPDGHELKAIIPGGSSVPVLTADEVDTALDFDSMAARGTMLGSGAVIVMDERCCMVQLGLRVAQFYMHESCGKCTPCREGTRWMVSILRKIEDGEASQGELDLLLNVCDRILGNCLCPLGDAAAMPVASYVAKFRDEYQRHIDEGGCPFHGDSTLDHVMAPVDQHHARIRAEIEVPA